MTAFEFGDKVRASVELKRRWVDSMKRWVTAPIADYDAWGHATHAREGVVIGKRTLANGIVHWGSYDESTYFEAKERLEAYLVAFDMRRKPFLVLAEDLTRLEDVA